MTVGPSLGHGFEQLIAHGIVRTRGEAAFKVETTLSATSAITSHTAARKEAGRGGFARIAVPVGCGASRLALRYRKLAGLKLKFSAEVRPGRIADRIKCLRFYRRPARN